MEQPAMRAMSSFVTSVSGLIGARLLLLLMPHAPCC
jgi:hypothetical protein